MERKHAAMRAALARAICREGSPDPEPCPLGHMLRDMANCLHGERII
jgi:hypothetical protein